MKFISEEELKKQFWKKYGYRKNILSYQFECQARHGVMDLVTIEKVKDDKNYHIEIVSFEFKLADIDKVFSQAYYNTLYCHKSFIVIPSDKKKVVLDRYSSYFTKYPSIGCIAVSHESEGGKWDIFHKPIPKADDQIHLNRDILKLCTKTL